MNRFCVGLLLAWLGVALVFGGLALWHYVEGTRALVFGGLLIVMGPFFTLAAVLEWWKADDAENLFGPPISREDYFAGVAIPYAEAPLALSLKTLKKKATEKAADGALVLRPSTGKGVLHLFPWAGPKGHSAQVEVRRRGDVEPGTTSATADEPVIYSVDLPDVTSALDIDWQWYGVMSGNAFPLLPDTLWYVCKGASVKLKKRRACAVLFCDGQTLRVYPARRMAAVQALLKSIDK